MYRYLPSTFEDFAKKTDIDIDGQAQMIEGSGLLS